MSYLSYLQSVELLPFLRLDERYPALSADQLILILCTSLFYQLLYILLNRKFHLSSQWSFRCLSLLHAIIAAVTTSYLAWNYFPIFSLSQFNENYVCDPDPEIVFLCRCMISSSAAYFLWDIFLCLRSKTKKRDELLHAAMGLVMAFSAVLIPWGPKFKMCILHVEVSTVFLRAYSMFYALKYTNFAHFLRFCFVIAFVYRTIVSFWMCYEFFGCDVYWNFHGLTAPKCMLKVETFMRYIGQPLCAILTFLNIFWMAKIINRIVELLGNDKGLLAGSELDDTIKLKRKEKAP